MALKKMPRPEEAAEQSSRRTQGARPSRGSKSLRRVSDLVTARLAPEEHAAALEQVAERYAVALTPTVVELIDAGDPADPIARQFVPDAAELETAPEERDDPIGDVHFSPVKGIVHRYPDRVLLKPHHACPVYCRFCFRREQVGPEGEALGADGLAEALDYIRARPAIWEVILTGGDPLLMSPRRLSELLGALDAIGHLGALRIHTRVPVVDPERVDEELVAALATEKAFYVAIHANHPRELTPAFRAACRRLARAGIALLGQSVLLAGVNDDPGVLEALLRGLVAAGVKPYYLHHPDLARGTRRFRLDLAEGRRIIGDLRGRISGLCQPAYVLDLPGGRGKVPVAPSAATADGDASWIIEDFCGGRHRYPPPPRE